QRKMRSSLLNWTRWIIRVRRSHPAFARGDIAFLAPANPKILAYLRTLGDEILLCVANLSETAQAAELDLSEWAGRVPVEMFGGYAGAHMVKAGEDVTFIDFWPEHVEHMKQHGLTITHLRDVEPFTVPARALHVTELQQISKEKPFDIAFVCTKSYDTAWATAM